MLTFLREHIIRTTINLGASLVTQTVKDLPPMQGIQV